MPHITPEIEVHFRWWAMYAIGALMLWQRLTRREWPRLDAFVCKHAVVIKK